jgi:hypothetical protein
MNATQRDLNVKRINTIGSDQAFDVETQSDRMNTHRSERR